MVLFGHVLSGRCNGLKGWYFFHGSASIGMLKYGGALYYFLSQLVPQADDAEGVSSDVVMEEDAGDHDGVEESGLINRKMLRRKY